MNVQLLKTFLSVAELENVRQAAKQLGFTQPTVTFQIQSLEKYYNVVLFQRVGKKIVLTAAGKAMMDYAEKVLVQLKEVQSGMTAFQKKNFG